MRMLKWVVAGQILFALVQFQPHKKDFTEEEKRDYRDLKKCADILLHKKENSIINRMTHDPTIIEIELAALVILSST